MGKSNYTYRLKWIITSVILLELIFWSAYYLILRVFTSSFSGNSSDHLMFKHPESLKLLLFIAPIIGVYLYSIYKHNRLSKKIGNSAMKSLLQPVSSSISFIKYFLFRNAIVLLILALAQPIYGKKKVAGTSESLELVIALDISNSMNCRDISSETSRLEIAKRALVQLVNNLHGEKIGVTLFANSAFVQLPLTRDYSAAKLFIQEIETGMISSQGTNIAEALEVSADMFSKEITTKGIILVTDGENHERNPDEILKKIKDTKLQLSVLGIGTTQGGLIPKNPNRLELGYKSNALGKTVVSKLNPAFLNSIAKKGGGKASTSSDEFPNLSELLTQINQMKRTKIDTLEFDIKQERYQIPLFLSMFFWMTFILWSSNYRGILKRR
jgi:Ca-activated chloride channel family protein